MKKKEIPSKQLQSVTHNGSVHKGIVLDPSEGFSIGCIRLAHRGVESIEKYNVLERSEDAVHASQIEDTWEALQKRAAVSVVMKKRASPEEIVRMSHARVGILNKLQGSLRREPLL